MTNLLNIKYVVELYDDDDHNEGYTSNQILKYLASTVLLKKHYLFSRTQLKKKASMNFILFLRQTGYKEAVEGCAGGVKWNRQDEFVFRASLLH